MEEVYRPISGYEGMYEISNLGNIVSLKRGRYTLKSINHGDGYLQVKLYHNGIGISYLIHKLVAEEFIDNPKYYVEVNHKNENKTDNNTDNLEWCTRSYNVNYGTRNTKMADKLYKKVVQTSIYGVVIMVWNSTKEAVEHGYGKTAISLCCNGHQKLHKGCSWKFKEEDIDETNKRAI